MNEIMKLPPEIEITPLGLRIVREISEDKYMQGWKYFGQAHEKTLIYIGDYANQEGMIKNGVRSDFYDEVEENTSYKRETIVNAKYVMGAINLSCRHERLGFKHYQYIAPLLEEERKKWIDKCVKNEWSVAILKKEIDKEKNKPPNYLYNIWSLAHGDNKDFFGAFPEQYMRNLLYYHTDEGNLIYDPFAGSGTTIDVCGEMNRKCYCSDLFPKRDDIEQWDIAKGLPDNLPEIQLAFIDPPYCSQAKGKYSADLVDLGNMTLDQFHKSMKILFNGLIDLHIPKIAAVIRPDQPPSTMIFDDSIFRFHELLMKHYRIEMRYILPYTTQQFTAYMVVKAKNEKTCIILHRDLVIWKLK